MATDKHKSHHSLFFMAHTGHAFFPFSTGTEATPLLFFLTNTNTTPPLFSDSHRGHTFFPLIGRHTSHTFLSRFLPFHKPLFIFLTSTEVTPPLFFDSHASLFFLILPERPHLFPFEWQAQRPRLLNLDLICPSVMHTETLPPSFFSGMHRGLAFSVFFLFFLWQAQRSHLFHFYYTHWGHTRLTGKIWTIF